MGLVANALAAGYHCIVWWLSLVCQVVISVLSGGYQMVISALLHDLAAYPSFIAFLMSTIELPCYHWVISPLFGGYPSGYQWVISLLFAVVRLSSVGHQVVILVLLMLFYRTSWLSVCCLVVIIGLSLLLYYRTSWLSVGYLIAICWLSNCRQWVIWWLS